MKILLLIILSTLTLSSYSQKVISGALYDYQTNKPLKFSPKTDPPQVHLSGKGKKGLDYPVDKNGHFTIPAADLDSFGKTLTFGIWSFYSTDLKTYDYADFEIVNIPRDSVQLVLSKVFLRKAYWMKHGGDDNLIVNNNTTFTDSIFVVNNGLIKYTVRRDPKMMNKEALAGKYKTDIQTDIIK